MMDRPVRTRFRAWAALAGLVSAAVLLGVAEVLALLLEPTASPLLAVGSFVIDIVPAPVKDLAIALFGLADKVALLAGLVLAVVIAAALGGVLQLLRPPLGVVVVLVAGGLATAAVVTRTGATGLAFVPTAGGVLAASVVLVLLGRRLRDWRAVAGEDHEIRPARIDADLDADLDLGRDVDVDADDVEPRRRARSDGVDRRRFLVLAAVAGASALLAGGIARTMNAATASIEAIRTALRLPAASTTVTIPAGAELNVPGVSPLFTPNDDFYRIDTAFTVPRVDPASWTLVITGMVDQRVELTFDDLLAMGVDEYAITLTCVSNQVGGDLVGTAMWLGVPIRDVLRLAGPQSGADMVLSTSIDGFTAGTPLSSLTDDGIDAILAVGMNGEPLPLEHGFPVRMVVPGLYGYVSATKWVTELKVTTFAQDEAYWTPRGWSAEGPIKLSSRIDTPRIGTPVLAGPIAIAGVAWAQPVGVAGVEVQIDDGDWQSATLSTTVSDDMWVQWFLAWDATPGTHEVVVRATSKDGELQTDERAAPAPNGSSGWQRSRFTVS